MTRISVIFLAFLGTVVLVFSYIHPTVLSIKKQAIRLSFKQHKKNLKLKENGMEPKTKKRKNDRKKSIPSLRLKKLDIKKLKPNVIDFTDDDDDDDEAIEASNQQIVTKNEFTKVTPPMLDDSEV